MHLALSDCSIIGNQLSKFAPHSPPCLETLEFYTLRGVVNSDLLALLMAVAPTLTTLNILDCEIQRHHPDEEHAIDSAVSKVVYLQILNLSGDCCTALSIARGTPRRHPQVPSISVTLVPAIDCQSLRKALEVTGWLSVTVWGGRPTIQFAKNCRILRRRRVFILLCIC